MRQIAIALAAAFAIVAAPAAVNAAPCKDAKGKFVKCPPAAKATTAPAAKTVAKASTTTKVTKTVTKKGPCRDAKGRFAKCK